MFHVFLAVGPEDGRAPVAHFVHLDLRTRGYCGAKKGIVKAFADVRIEDNYLLSSVLNPRSKLDTAYPLLCLKAQDATRDG